MTGPDISITQIADSLALMQFCSLIERRLSKRITPADVLENDTPRSQATLLHARGNTHDRGPRDAQPLPTMPSASQFWLTTSVRSKLVSHITELGFD